MTVAVLLTSLVAVALALVILASPPQLGLTLAAAEGTDRVVVLADGGDTGIAVGSTLLSITGDSDERLALRAMDMAEEPDAFESYPLLAEFFARQAAIMAALRNTALTLEIATIDEVPHTLTMVPAHRGIVVPGARFWVQVFVGCASLLLGAWVWSLRRGDRGAQLYAATGAAIFTFTLPAAIYSSRELALDPASIRVLSGLNHAGAMAFGVIMMAFFLSYPVALVSGRVLGLLFGAVAIWVGLDVLWLLPGPVYGVHLATTAEMVLILVCAGWQFHATRGDPRARAILNWLGLSVLVGAGGFILTIAAPLLLGASPVLPQGYAFLFFLLIYGGVALGVGRYRLFELDAWAFRILFHAGGVVLLLVLDAVLSLSLSFDRAPALGLSLLVVGVLYLPLRDGLARRFSRRTGLDGNRLFEAGVRVAFTPPAEDRDAAWRTLLERLFEPLIIAAVPDPRAGPEIREEGLELVLPAVAGLPALQLRYPFSGRGLFGAPHLATARQLLELLTQADEARRAYGRGALEERRRIAADLHDDVGARLLSSLHQSDAERIKGVVREAMADIRTIAIGLAGDRLPVDSVLADLRYETSQRLDDAGIELQWPPGPNLATGQTLDYPVYRNLISSHREIVSNLIRHSGAKRLSVELSLLPSEIRLAYVDDGVGLTAGAMGTGSGIANIRKRMQQVGGVLSFGPPAVAPGLRIDLALPLGAPEA